MKRTFYYALMITTGALIISCQSDTEKMNEVINSAIAMEKAAKAAENQPAPDSVKLAIQTSAYTNPVKVVPTQQELIKKHRVKSVKQIYKDGWSIENYDKKGNKISEESDYSGKKTFSYEFDKNGNVIKEKTKWKDGTTTSQMYEYNTEGKVIRKTYKDDSDGKTSVTTFEYNADLNTRIESSDLGKEKEFYDNRGLRVRFESFDEKGNLMGSGEAQYNEDGLKVSESANIIGMSNQDEFEYNEAGQLIKQHRTGILDVYFLFEYDEKGLMINSNNVKGYNEEKTTYEYTFY
ncbi:MAG TPA: hypothetical protein VGF30_10695 [Bacteroidia bacterium]